MTTKEKIIRQSLKKATKRLKYLEDIQNATPASDLMEVRKEANKLLEENKGIEARTSKSFIDEIEKLSKREAECWKLINRQQKWEKDSDEMVKLMVEISELKN
jgi:hypothetical protein